MRGVPQGPEFGKGWGALARADGQRRAGTRTRCPPGSQSSALSRRTQLLLGEPEGPGGVLADPGWGAVVSAGAASMGGGSRLKPEWGCSHSGEQSLAFGRVSGSALGRTGEGAVQPCPPASTRGPPSQLCFQWCWGQ